MKLKRIKIIDKSISNKKCLMFSYPLKSEYIINGE